MGKKELMWGIGGLLVGVIFASKIRSLPLLDKLP